MDKHQTDEFSSFRDKYNYTAYLSRRDWAYEHVRRIPEYEAAAWQAQSDAISEKIACHSITVLKMRAPQPEAEKWGLHFFPNPGVAAPKAHVFWTDEVHTEKVSINVYDCPEGEVDTTFLETIQKCRMAHLTDHEGREHLVINGNGCSVQVKCSGKSLVTANPVKTVFTVEGFDNIEHHARILKESRRVYGDQLSQPLVFSRKAELLRNGLIALDGERAGLSDRKVAWIIFGKDLVEAGHENGDRSLIRRIKTYRDNAMALCDGGYREFLLSRPVQSNAA